jgi:hypothetical protein
VEAVLGIASWKGTGQSTPTIMALHLARRDDLRRHPFETAALRLGSTASGDP